MTYDELKQLVSVYIDGEATPQEEDIVLNALKDNEELRKFYNELLALSQTLQDWPDETLSPDMEHTLHKTIQQEGKPMKKKSWIMPAGATVAVAFLVFVYSHRVLTARVGSTIRMNDKSTSSGSRIFYEPHNFQKKMRGGLRKGADNIVDQSPGVIKAAVIKDEMAGRSRAAYKMPETIVRQAAMESLDARAMSDYTVPRQDVTFGGAEPEYRLAYSSPELFPRAKTIGPVSPDQNFNTEQYDFIQENEFFSVDTQPLSTFSIDVDTASYANVRRFLNNRQMPPKDAVRIEEMVNYFSYDYTSPTDKEPFSITTEISACPWNAEHQLALIGLKGKTFKAGSVPKSNLVFLIDVSGSMKNQNKLPLLKEGFRMMVDQLRPEETVSLVTYAGRAAVLLDSVPGSEKYKILDAIDQLYAGGSTAGTQGIITAYDLAKKNFIEGGNNRVILATDGDFNVGVSSNGELIRMIEEKRKSGIFLTILGFGTGNYKDARMEQIANKGNGNYYYIDTHREARKVMVEELGSTLFTIAKDVKIQIEFNPAHVKGYRLIGYENRKLANQDFNDDTKDAGELGAGHTVTALYEIIPATSQEVIGGEIDPLKYQKTDQNPQSAYSNEIMTVKLRYKEPDGETSKLITQTVKADALNKSVSDNFVFVSAVAEFGLLLRDSQFKAQASYDDVLKCAAQAKGADTFGYRQEFIDLVNQAKQIHPVPATNTVEGYGFK